MEQLERIKAMEQALDSATEAVAVLSEAAEKYRAVQGQLQKLTDYYGGGQWRQDYEDDCAGKLPADLKRGVLSEDAVYDLLAEHDRLMERLRELTNA